MQIPTDLTVALQWLILSLLGSSLAQFRPIRTTSSGEVQGKTSQFQLPTYDQSTRYVVDEYLGIPYAEPPIDALRFAAPRPVKPWSGVKQVTEKSNSCFQSLDTSFELHPGVQMWNANTELSEDCLYLNIWAPRVYPHTLELLPVMVWIYGGGFTSGTASLEIYDGRVLAATQNVIVASLNYRLGPLGFFYLNNDRAPGNVGLLDQQVALKWIKKNIQNFSGDPERITIFGESAGAASVSFHLLARNSFDTFNYAIMESASALVPWAYRTREEALVNSYHFAHVMNLTLSSSQIARFKCFVGDYLLPCEPSSVSGSSSNGSDAQGNPIILGDQKRDDMLYCLRHKSPREITESQWQISTRYFHVPLGVVADGDFLHRPPAEIIKNGEIKRTSILLGSNKDEGSYFLLYGMQRAGFGMEEPLAPMNNLKFKKLVGNMFYRKHSTPAIEAILFHYANSKHTSVRPNFRDILDDISGDYEFICPVVGFADVYSRANEAVFMYYFNYRTEQLPWPKWMGVPHGYEVDYVFGVPFFDPVPHNLVYTEADRRISHRVMRLFTNFAKHGNPNRPQSELTLDWEWPKYDHIKRTHLVIGATPSRELSFEAGTARRYGACTFWNEYVPYMRPHWRNSKKTAAVCSRAGSILVAAKTFAIALITSLLCVVLMIN